MKPEYITIAVTLIICTYFFIKSMVLKSKNKMLSEANDELYKKFMNENSGKNRLQILVDEKDVKIAQLQSDNKNLDFLLVGHTDTELELLKVNGELNKRVEELLFQVDTLKAQRDHKKKPTKKLSWEMEENFTIG